MLKHYCRHCDKPLSNGILLDIHQANCLDLTKPKLVNLGKERIQVFSLDDISHLFDMDNIITRLFKHINLDSDRPRYHNIIYTNSRSKNALVFRTNKWIKVDVMQICEEVIDHKIRFLESFVKVHEIDNENVRDQMKLLSNDVSARKSVNKQMRILLIAKKEMIKESMSLLTPPSVLVSSFVSTAI